MFKANTTICVSPSGFKLPYIHNHNYYQHTKHKDNYAIMLPHIEKYAQNVIDFDICYNLSIFLLEDRETVLIYGDLTNYTNDFDVFNNKPIIFEHKKILTKIYVGEYSINYCDNQDPEKELEYIVVFGIDDNNNLWFWIYDPETYNGFSKPIQINCGESVKSIMPLKYSVKNWASGATIGILTATKYFQYKFNFYLNHLYNNKPMLIFKFSSYNIDYTRVIFLKSKSIILLNDKNQIIEIKNGKIIKCYTEADKVFSNGRLFEQVFYLKDNIIYNLLFQKKIDIYDDSASFWLFDSKNETIISIYSYGFYRTTLLTSYGHIIEQTFVNGNGNRMKIKHSLITNIDKSPIICVGESSYVKSARC